MIEVAASDPRARMRMMMSTFIISEVIFFTVLVLAYVVYHGAVQPTAL